MVGELVQACNEKSEKRWLPVEGTKFKRWRLLVRLEKIEEVLVDHEIENDEGYKGRDWFKTWRRE